MGKPINVYRYAVTITDHDPRLGGNTMVFRYGTRLEVQQWAEREVADTLAVIPTARVTYQLERA